MAARSVLKYPQPGTMADRILGFIRENPGCSTNRIWNSLGINPSPARQCLKNLLEREMIEDAPNGEGHHRYTATEKGMRA